MHEGGPAQLAGVKPGDLLLRVGYTQIRPPEAPLFPMGATSRLLVAGASGQERIIEIKVPQNSVRLVLGNLTGPDVARGGSPAIAGREEWC